MGPAGPPPSSTCTTIVRLLSCGCSFFFGGCGTSALSPWGVIGVITMKMMISTSMMSIMGVMLMSEVGPLLPPPTFMAMANSPWRRRARSALAAAGHGNALGVHLLRDHPDLVTARRAHRIHDIGDVAVLGAAVGADINGLVEPILQQVLDLIGDLIQVDHFVVEKDAAVVTDADDDRVGLVGRFHRHRMLRAGEIDLQALLQHGRDHHE